MSWKNVDWSGFVRIVVFLGFGVMFIVNHSVAAAADYPCVDPGPCSCGPGLKCVSLSNCAWRCENE